MNTKIDWDSFWKRVNVGKNKDCWNWKKGLDKDGYGQVSFGNKKHKAHRLSFIFHFGEIPTGMGVLHRCDNPSCVNPGHLFYGTAQDNASDKVKKQRHLFGESHPMSKLKYSDIPEIKSRYDEGRTQKEIALEFGVSQASVCRAINRICWKGA